MVHQLLTPNAVSWNATMSACEKGKQWEEALGLLTPVVVSFTASISAYEKG